MDAIVVGIGTALADDPLLTARPAGPRVATRVVIDSEARLPVSSQLVRTSGEAPVIVAVGPKANPQKVTSLAELGLEVLLLQGLTHAERLEQLLVELGKRRMTNVLVEGGAGVLGGLHDGQHIDEVHVFVAPKLIGGENASAPIGGMGLDSMGDTGVLTNVRWQQMDNDVHLNARVKK